MRSRSAGGRRSGRRHRHGLAAWAIALAVILRAMLPAGVMPDPTARADGRFDIVTCLGLVIAAPGEASGDGNTTGAGTVCDFAVTAMADRLPVPVALPLPAMVAEPRPQVMIPAAAPVTARAGPPLGATAPPRPLPTLA
ncbi:hypothetical protein GCM10011505_07920 [Tistrella bauzanensis]|uniref:Uncharacterized protein n=1 Tax=Tistrella bauzanensis TaxID=657419 RepID=A0ABQ1IB52_9PROT|nr:hypothetical protein [Tistrella bauzanensis]GGB29023.1 hypothetical protein GCM10011505_07920 [Tistrella bauzanensis]